MNESGFGRSLSKALAEGAWSGAALFSLLAPWVFARTLPFNPIGGAETFELALLLFLAYSLAGAVAGIVVGLGLHLLGARRRLNAPVAALLAAALSFWILRERVVGLGPPALLAGVGAVLSFVAVVALSRGPFGGRMKRSTALTFTLSVVVLFVVGLWPGGGDGGAAEELRIQLSGVEPQEPPLLVLALDGVDWEVLNPLLDAGELPALSRLRDRAAWGALESMEPTWSPPLWTSFWTGKLPAEHGITFFLARGSFRLPSGQAITLPRLLGSQRLLGPVLEEIVVPVNSRLRRSTAIWEVAGLAGESSVLVNRLVSWPALPLRGVELTSRILLEGEDDETLSFPAELAAQLRPRLDGVAPLDEPALASTPWLARELAREAELWRAGIEQAHANDAGLIILYTHLIDSAHHRYLKYHWPERFRFEVDAADVARFSDVIPATYRAVDAMVGEALAALPGARVLIISDHGIQPNLELTHDEPEPVGRTEMPEAELGSVSGVHGDAPDGIFLLAGEGVRPRHLTERVHLLEIAPTMLELMGLPAAQDMEWGSLLERWPDLVQIRRLDPVSSYAGVLPRAAGGLEEGASDAEVLERLRALGYVD